jgi:hypothetical protein
MHLEPLIELLQQELFDLLKEHHLLDFQFVGYFHLRHLFDYLDYQKDQKHHQDLLNFLLVFLNFLMLIQH